MTNDFHLFSVKVTSKQHSLNLIRLGVFRVVFSVRGGGVNLTLLLHISRRTNLMSI